MRIRLLLLLSVFFLSCQTEKNQYTLKYISDEINLLKYKIQKPKHSDKPLIISSLNTENSTELKIDLKDLISKIQLKLPVMIQLSEKIFLDSTINYRIKIEEKQWEIKYIFEKILIQKIDNSIFGILAITNEDIYPSEGWNYVFGKAESQKRVAIVSTYRLNNNSSLIEKIVLHEIGHLLKLSHCERPLCVMQKTHNVEDIENISENFCVNCKQKLNILK